MSAFGGGFLGQSRIEYSELVGFNAACLFAFKIHPSHPQGIKIYGLRSQIAVSSLFFMKQTIDE